MNKEINEAYLFLRKNNQSVDSRTLEFMRDVSLRASNGELCLLSEIQSIIKTKMDSIAKSNTYRGKVNQTAQWTISILEDIQAEITKLNEYNLPND
jgi:hypothetical protein